MQRRPLLQFPLVHTGGVRTGGRRDLVGDDHQRVEALLTGDVEIVLQLPRRQDVAAGLDLHQRRPHPGPAAHPQQPVGVDTLLPQRERHLDEGLHRTCRGTQRRGQRPAVLRTAVSTANNAEVARRSCSSAPLIPDTGIETFPLAAPVAALAPRQRARQLVAGPNGGRSSSCLIFQATAAGMRTLTF